MSNANVNVTVIRDEATAAVRQLAAEITGNEVKDAVGTACSQVVKEHFGTLPANKMGAPSSHFWEGCQRGTDWEPVDRGILISCDNEAKPGALRQRFYGGTIEAKGKLLTIPARTEFYNRKATDFTNLRFVMFGRGGAKALVVGKGGTGRVNFATGREQSVKGTGARAAGVVAYWLKDKVHQDGNPDVIPDEEQLADVAVDAVTFLLQKKGLL